MIYIECQPDEVLVKTLGISEKEIIHAGGKGNVCNRLSKASNCKGLIDEDPYSAQPGYIKKLKLLIEAHKIKVLYDEKLKNYLIILSPRLEEWILEVAKETKSNLSDYGLSNDADELHKIINTSLGNFKKFIEDIAPKSEMVKSLKKFIKEQRR